VTVSTASMAAAGVASSTIASDRSCVVLSLNSRSALYQWSWGSPERPSSSQIW
jgi:hypothetical protein